jgi:hypothetical protein
MTPGELVWLDGELIAVLVMSRKLKLGGVRRIKNMLFWMQILVLESKVCCFLSDIQISMCNECQEGDAEIQKKGDRCMVGFVYE